MGLINSLRNSRMWNTSLGLVFFAGLVLAVVLKSAALWPALLVFVLTMITWFFHYTIYDDDKSPPPTLEMLTVAAATSQTAIVGSSLADGKQVVFGEYLALGVMIGISIFQQYILRKQQLATADCYKEVLRTACKDKDADTTVFAEFAANTVGVDFYPEWGRSLPWENPKDRLRTKLIESLPAKCCNTVDLKCESFDIAPSRRQGSWNLYVWCTILQWGILIALAVFD